VLASYFKPPSVFLNTLIGLLGSGWDPVLGGSRVRYFLAPGTGLPPILNAQALDGIPLTIGQSITLQGSSPAIEWQDSIGRVLGRGSQLVYTAEQVKMETLTAQVGESSSRVSFTVSEPGFEVAPHIKAFPDAAKSLIVQRDLRQGRLGLKLDPMLPTLQVGDVVVGAEYRIPPVRITRLEVQGNQLNLQVALAQMQDVLRSGVLDQWQVWLPDNANLVEGRSSGGCQLLGVQLEPLQWRFGPQEVVPPQTEEFAVEIPPALRWKYFEEVKARLQGSFQADAFWEAQFCPVLRSPKVDFLRRRVEAEVGFRDTKAKAYVQMQGVARLSSQYQTPRARIPLPIRERNLLKVLVIPLKIPIPVPIWWGMQARIGAQVQVSAELSTTARVGFELTSSTAMTRLIYDGQNESQPFRAEEVEKQPGQIQPIFQGEAQAQGTLTLELLPQVTAGLWIDYWPVEDLGVDDDVELGILLPQVGLRPRLDAVLEIPFEEGLEISDPKEQTYAGNSSIPLLARVVIQPTLTFYGGLDVTIGEGETEEDSCPVNLEGQRSRIELRSANFGSPCERAPPNPSGNPYPCTTDLRTGQNIPYPLGAGQEPPARIPGNQRVTWNSRTKKQYRTKYECQYERPKGDDEWSRYDVHHIFPLEYGGKNDFWNLVPLLKVGEHPQFTKYWSGWRPSRQIPTS